MRLYALILTTLIIASCGDGQVDHLSAIEENEELIRVDSARDALTLDQIEDQIDRYSKFIAAYPDDERVPAFQFRSVMLHFHFTDDHQKAHEAINEVLAKHASWSNRNDAENFQTYLVERRKQDEQFVVKAEELIAGSTETRLDRGSYMQIYEAFKNFATAYPKDARSPELLYRAAIIQYRNLGGAKEAVAYLEQLYRDNKGFEKLPETIFWLGYIYDNEFDNINMARPKYQEFVSSYPDHELANDAKVLLEFLGKSDDEILEELLKKQQNS
jgi:tetratricopeptide (TPR) repeat protein